MAAQAPSMRATPPATMTGLAASVDARCPSPRAGRCRSNSATSVGREHELAVGRLGDVDARIGRPSAKSAAVASVKQAGAGVVKLVVAGGTGSVVELAAPSAEVAR